MELFEKIRKLHFKEGEKIRAIARDLGIHRRTVREAIENAVPEEPKPIKRKGSVITEEIKTIIKGWLEGDKEAPRKQRHTAKKVYSRLVEEECFEGSESNLRRVVKVIRRKIGLIDEAFVPLVHQPGEEAEVDWYEARINFPKEETKLYFFVMRACASGREFHVAYQRMTQQAFLDAHVKAFEYFGGVFNVIRFDNLTSAVKKVLKGRIRKQSDKFIALRSHYLFEAEFCRSGIQGAHEKGGVEGSVGRFRRNHLVPVPCFANLDALNKYLHQCCQEDDQRTVEGHTQSIIVDWSAEVPLLHKLPAEPFSTAEVTHIRVQPKSLVSVSSNRYSVPVEYVGQLVDAHLTVGEVEVFSRGKRIARHLRLMATKQTRAQLYHYLPLLKIKPGAMKRSLPLQQARDEKCWPKIYDTVWNKLNEAHGETEGTLEFIDILYLSESYSKSDIEQTLQQSVELGCINQQAVRVLLRKEPESELARLTELGELEQYNRPERDLSEYDALLEDEL